MSPGDILFWFGWVLPSTILTIHTVVNILYLYLKPIDSNLPIIVGVGILTFLNDPFGTKVVKRPGWGDCAGLLGTGLAPIVSIIILFIYFMKFIMYWHVRASMKRELKKRPKRKLGT